MFPQTEMLDLVLVDGHAKGIVTRDLVTGENRIACRRRGRARHRRLRQCLLSLDQRARLQRHRHVSRLQAGARSLPIPVTPKFIPPASRSAGDYQSKLTLMSRVAPQRRPGLGSEAKGGLQQAAHEIPEEERDYYLERKYPSYRKSGAARYFLAQRQGSLRRGPRRRSGRARRLPRFRRCDQAPRAKMYVASVTAISSKCMKRSPAKMPIKRPMRIYPAVHYTMGGSWVDYNLMSNVPGLHVIGEANFSDHGANRLGASALMQGLADGYFVLPYTIGNYLAGEFNKKRPQPSDPAFQQSGKGGPRTRPAPAQYQWHPNCRQLPSRAWPPHVGQMRDGPRKGRPGGSHRPDAQAP